MPDGPLEDTGVATKRTGSFIRFKPDPNVFSETDFNLETVEERLNELAFLNRGLEITLIDERISMAEANLRKGNLGDDEEESENETETEPQAFLLGKVDALALESEPYRIVYKYNGGISDFVQNLNEGKTKLYSVPIYYQATKNNILVEFAIQHTTDFTESLFSFVNNIPTPEGGYHEAGFRSGLVKALNDYARSNGFLKDKDPNFQGDDFREGLTAVLSIKMQNVQFEGQTKTKLGNTEARVPVEATVIEGLNSLMGARGYKKTFDEIIKKAQGAAKVRLAAKQAKENARAKNSIDGLTLIGKLASCSGRKPELNEMFIVEGDSAMGAVKSSRDSEYQAIMPIRGKILNCLKADYARIFKSDVIVDLIKVMGCGVELGGKHNKELATFNLDNLRFNKIVICTDADVDGYQIRTLVLTMLYRLTPTLINKGYVYIAESPLYEITTKDRTYFAYTESEKAAFLQKIGDKKYTIQRSKGLGENDPEMMWLTTMNPESRRLIKVMPTDVVQTAQVFDILLGDNLAGRKEHIAQHGAEYLDDLDVS